ncbi:DgyrCDS13772 [Dimorphilus gyrociliatus]|uniref:DgyrCDS13772 n=1 Tax=Dimorphilus gyrociliatus TaxID=2664684 RepID=A0A7I8WBQ0_9ANNE|nr:DgyrCDS13772 [Dimorphilus gyrociliatus]
MFQRFSRALHNAVETMSSSPKPTTVQEFIKSMRQINSYYVSTQVHKVSIEQTHIPSCLDRMLSLLLEEDGGDSSTGPCLEYLLQDKVLLTLSTLGKTDVPPGMKQAVLQFCTKLLQKHKHQLLPQVNVYHPINKLIILCGETLAAPTETDEVAFLSTVCSKFMLFPNLAPLFIQGSYTLCSNVNGTESESSNDNFENQVSFPLVDSLLLLLQSPDSRVVVKACEGLFLISSVAHISCTKALIKHTKFCETLTHLLVTQYNKIPDILDPADVEHIYVAWGLRGSQANEHHFKGKQVLVDFLSWLDYADRLIASAQPSVAQALASAISSIFFKGTFLPAFLQACEQKAITATCLLIRCNHVCDELTIITLKVFETLIMKCSDTVLDILILDCLKQRLYVIPPAVKINGETEKYSSIDEAEEDKESSEELEKATSHLVIEDEDDDDDRFSLHNTVCSYLNLIPEELQSSIANSDCAFDAYIQDAQTQCLAKPWPKTPQDVDIVNSIERGYKESDFLQVLLDKLSRTLTQSYAVNLQVTLVASRLGLIPHVLIDELLISSLTNLTIGARSYYTVLKKIIEDVKVRCPPDFCKTLEKTRSDLMGTQNTPLKNGPNNQLALTIILLEEFCKELSAIAFVKQNARDLECYA